MATQPPPPSIAGSGPNPSTSAPMHGTPSASSSTVQSDNSPNINNNARQHNWDGDRMLHIYMLDYCRKRGFKAVVAALCQETNTMPDVKAPIDAPQGLLFEWWVVFWDIFTAKHNDVGGSKEAMSYAKAQRIRPDQLRNQTWAKAGQFPLNPGMGGPLPLNMHQSQTMPMMNGVLPQHTGGMPLPVGSHPGHVGPGGQPPPQPPPFGHPLPNGSIPGQPHPPPSNDQQSPAPASNLNGPQPYPPQQQNQRQQPLQRGLNQPHTGAPNPNQHAGPPPQHESPHLNPASSQGMNPNQQASQPHLHQQPPPPPLPGANPNSMIARQQAQMGGRPLGQANGPSQQMFGAGSPLGGPHGPTPSPQISQMGHPTGHPHGNAQLPHGQMNGVPGGTPSQQFAVPGAMVNSARPQSRSGTPNTMMMPGMGSSPSRAGGMQRPASSHSQMNAPGQMGGGFNVPPPPQNQGNSAPGTYGSVSPHQVEMAMKQCNFTGRDPNLLNPEEKKRLYDTLKAIQSRGTPRLASANPTMGGPSTPGMNPLASSGPSQGGPGFNPQQRPQDMLGYQQQGLHQHHAAMGGKRPGSPSNAPPESSPRDSSPPDRKRPRRNSQTGAGMNSMPGYAPGVPNASGPQPQMQNGAAGMMRPPSQSSGRPLPPGMIPNGINQSGNPGHPQPPNAGNQQLRQQNPQSRYNSMIQPSNKPPGMMPNPHPSGLPIPVLPNSNPADPSSHPGASSVGNRIISHNKMHPSPSLPAAKTPGNMPPPSHTPQPASKEKVKEETPGPSGLGDGSLNSNKSSPANKPIIAPPPTTINPSQTPTPSTPAAMGAPLVNVGGPFGSSMAVPSPSAILASANAQNHNTNATPNPGSRPGSSANNSNSGIPMIGAASSALSASRFPFPGPSGGSEYYANILDDYDISALAGGLAGGLVGKEELSFNDADFDQFLTMPDFPLMGVPDDDGNGTATSTGGPG